MRMERNNELKYMFVYLIAVLCFALGGVFVRFSQLGPIATGFYRMLFSLPFLLPLVWRELKRISRKDMLVIIISGVMLGVNIALWNLSLNMTTQANANLFANMHIFAVVPISLFVFKEKVRKVFLLGIVVTLVGAVILLSGKAEPSAGNFIGDAAAFISALLYGVYLTGVYQLRDRVSTACVLFVGAIGCMIPLCAGMLIFEQPQFPSTFAALWPIFAIIALGQFGGIGLVSFCLGKLRASLCSVLSLTQPAMAAIMGLVIFSERITLMEIVGIIIVSCGVYLAQNSNDGLRPAPAPAEAAAIAEAAVVAEAAVESGRAV
ncbi:MAG: DMT family transporter [Bacillota bacterium]|nr:DMT family transporter [Bacillota bacterium]